MELVYLWVEDYKNIHKQGFNFSPRFSCEYDDVKNELTIEENDDYIENFFGKNINVTAIVGKNGSGKSSIFQILYYLMYLNRVEIALEDKKEKKTTKENSIIQMNDMRERIIFNNDNLEKTFQKLSDEDIDAFLIINEKGRFYTINSAHKKIIYNKNYIETFKERISSQFIYFNYLGEVFENHFKHNWARTFYQDIENIKNDISIPLTCEPYIDKKSNLNLNDNKKIFSKRYARILNKIKDNNFLNQFFNPNKVRLSINESYFYNSLDTFNKNDNNNPFSRLFKIGYGMAIEKDDKYTITKEKYLNIKNIIKIALKEADLRKLVKIGIFFEILHNSKVLKNVEISYFRNLFIEKSVDKWLLEIEELLETEYSLISLLRDNNTKILELIGLLNLEQLLDSNIIDNMNQGLSKKCDIQEFYHVIRLLPLWINLELYDNEKELASLSGGEYNFLQLVTTVLHYIYFNQLDKNKNIYLLLDEIELGSHPDWQKSIVNNLIVFLKEFHINIKIIFATHSPFLLSDLPKENVIFLDKDEKTGKCIVIKDGLKKINQTFGANIHTLLSDSFFMEGGLMGEFAKGKINKIIKNLQDDEYTPNDQEKDKLLLIIESIGEPFLRSKMLDMYNRKFIKEYKNREKKKIEEQINDLNKKLKELGNDSDR